MQRMIREWRGKVYRESQHDGFYKSDEWLELRRWVFKRDNQTCVRCDKRYKLSDLNAHHLIPRGEGGADTIQNLVTLCDCDPHRCHDHVEINGYRTVADIAGSYAPDTPDDSPIEEPQEGEEDPFRRP